MLRSSALVLSLVAAFILPSCDKGKSKVAVVPSDAQAQKAEGEPKADSNAESGAEVEGPTPTILNAEVKTESNPNLITKPYFYKVTSPEGRYGYLLGTMHMGVDAKKDFPDFVWKGIDETDAVAVEADVTDPSLAMGLMLPKNTNLKKILGAEGWRKLETVLGAGVAQMLMPMKPAAAASFISMKFLPQTMPMDLLFMTEAKSQKKKLVFLEEGQFQLELLNRIMDRDFLLQMLDKANKEESDKLLQAYRDGDETALLTMLEDPEAWGPKRDAKKNRAAMLDNRNKSWIPSIESLLKTHRPFVAVGAAHLFGKVGVIELLRAKGYKVDRMQTPERVPQRINP